MSLEWVACSALTGRVLAEFPELIVGEVTTLIGAYSSVEATLPLVDPTPDWIESTLPGGVYLVLLDNSVPVWGGLVIRRVRTGGDALAMTLATPEAYFARRFVGDASFLDHDQCDIVEALIDLYVADSMPIRVEATPSSFLRDRAYSDDDDKTVLSVLTELSGVLNGPEWTVGWESGMDGEFVTYTPVLYVADRLGSGLTNGFGPGVTFDFPGAIASFEYVEDFGESAGANDVLAVSTAEGDVRPESDHAIFADPERLTFESRFTPSTSITSTSRLNAHAEAALARMQDGTTTLSVALDYGSSPKPGVAWNVGDTVGIAIGSGNTPVPAFPDGFQTTMRVLGYSYSLGDTPTLTPILVGDI